MVFFHDQRMIVRYVSKKRAGLGKRPDLWPSLKTFQGLLALREVGASHREEENNRTYLEESMAEDCETPWRSRVVR